MTKLPSISGCLAACALAAIAVTPASAAGDLATDFTLLAGFPESDSAAAGVLVVPGTVIPLDSGPPAQPIANMSGPIAELAYSLSRALRLEDVRVLYRYPVSLDVGEQVDLPPPTTTTGIRLSVELTGFNDRAATYHVVIRDGSEVLATSGVNALRGKRVVVGAQDGEEAPYLFLAVGPQSQGASAKVLRPVDLEEVRDVTPPRALHRPPPEYTAEAKEKVIEGVVILQTVIDRNGDIRDVKVLKGLPGGLSEAAADAVRQWRFEPATDADGKPIDVYYNLTVNFRLDGEEE